MHFSFPRVVFKTTTIDWPWYLEKKCVSWLLVCSPEVGALLHYAHMPLKTDTRQKRDRSCTHVPTWWKHWGTHRCAHWSCSVSVHTLIPIIVTDQRNAYSFYLHYRHVAHTVNTWTNQTDTWLCLTYALNHSQLSYPHRLSTSYLQK